MYITVQKQHKVKRASDLNTYS